MENRNYLRSNATVKPSINPSVHDIYFVRSEEDRGRVIYESRYLKTSGLQINIFSYKLPICGHYSGIVCHTFWWYLGVHVSSLPYYKVWNLTNLITCIMQTIVPCTVIAFLDFTLHSNSFHRLIVVYLVNNFITFINIASFRKKKEENVP